MCFLIIIYIYSDIYYREEIHYMISKISVCFTKLYCFLFLLVNLGKPYLAVLSSSHRHMQCQESNLGLYTCKAFALPLELQPQSFFIVCFYGYLALKFTALNTIYPQSVTLLIVQGMSLLLRFRSSNIYLILRDTVLF